jgi:Tfp pilus assembly protein PilN
MVEINLLPWRHYVRVYEVRQIKKMMAAFAVLAVLTLAAVHLLLSMRQQSLYHHALALEQKLTPLRKQLHVSQSLRNKGSHAIFPGQFFRALGQMPQSPVCFTDISSEQGMFIFAGQTRSAADLTDFLVHWKLADAFYLLRIEQMRQNGALLRFRFRGMETSVSDRGG